MSKRHRKTTAELTAHIQAYRDAADHLRHTSISKSAVEMAERCNVAAAFDATADLIDGQLAERLHRQEAERQKAKEAVDGYAAEHFPNGIIIHDHRSIIGHVEPLGDGRFRFVGKRYEPIK